MIKNLYDSLLNLVMPPFCSYCKIFLDTHTVFCKQCFARIEPIVSTAVHITKKHKLTVFSLSSYKDPLKRLILAKGRAHPGASKQMADLLWKRTIISTLDFDMVVPIPLHWTRKAWRGYNQAEVMAQHIAKLSNKPCVSLLKRIKRTVHQSQLGINERSENLKNAFALNQVVLPVANKHIVLVDDLMTTGATLQAAAKMLIQLKPLAISALVTCRVV